MASAHAGIAHQPHGQDKIEYLLLEEVKVKAWVVDVSSRIVLTQTFYNSSSEATGKAKYVFPLPASTAVCAFELEMEDGAVIVGEVKEKDKAASVYTHAVAQGKTAALVERVTDDIFTISVGSIPATTRVIANLTFLMDLLDEGLNDRIRLQLPMHIAERYGTPPLAMQNTSAADSRTRVRINVDIQTSDVIYDIGSPTHKIEVLRYKGRSGDKSKRRMSAVWKSPEFLKKDFVVTIHAEGLDKPRCFVEEAGESDKFTTAIQLTLVPKFLTPKIHSQEYIFIIDRSGSMAGASIVTAKRTLTMLLRLLPSGQTMFNIFSFGTNVTSLWGCSRGLEVNSLNEATLHVASMDADYGGTEIPSALQSAFNSRQLDRPAVVFLLTDGGINPNPNLNPWAVISNAINTSPPVAPTRLFVLGIGEEVSSDICTRLARHGHGEALFALSAEAIYGKCARLLNAGRSKNIESIDIDWGCGSSPHGSLPSPSTPLSLSAGLPALGPPPLVQQAPHSLTKIFTGIRFTVFAIMSSETVPNVVKLFTKLEGEPQPQELRVPVTKVKPFRDTHEDSIVPIIHTLAARKLVMELDDGVGPLPTPAPGDALLASEEDLRKAGIVRLGLTYQLVTEHTSFVVVRKGNERMRNRERGSGRNGWIRSRLRPTRQVDQEPQEDISEEPTLLDGFINGVSSFITSLFGFLGNPVVSDNGSRSRSHHPAPRLPGAYDGSESGENESSRGRGRPQTTSPPRQRSVSSQRSTDTFSTLSSLEGSSCSSCWTVSRSPSPIPVLQDPVDRAPSPDFQQVPGAGGHRPTNVGLGDAAMRPDRVSQTVYDLFLEMAVDGSFSATPLLIRLVGDAVLNKGDEIGVDRKVWVTVMTAAYMKDNLQAEPDLLELVTEKAKEFVESFNAVGGNGTRSFDELVRMAAGLLNVQPQ